MPAYVHHAERVLLVATKLQTTLPATLPDEQLARPQGLLSINCLIAMVTESDVSPGTCKVGCTACQQPGLG
jgi:hypothetical protein